MNVIKDVARTQKTKRSLRAVRMMSMMGWQARVAMNMEKQKEKEDGGRLEKTMSTLPTIVSKLVRTRMVVVVVVVVVLVLVVVVMLFVLVMI